MGVEELEKSVAAVTLDDKNQQQDQNNNTNVDDEDLEEGEITDEQNNSKSVEKPNKSIATKHTLEISWTFWFDHPSARSKQATWGSSIRPVFTFSTVEDFWSLYNNINQPSKLGHGADFHCFKHKIEPKWEDPICANGGKWTCSFQRGKSDTPWLYTLLALIGEQFEHGDEICGAVVNVRSKQEKIALWTKNAANEAAQLSIGRQWKKFVDYNESIGFIFHEDAMKYDKAAKSKYTC